MDDQELNDLIEGRTRLTCTWCAATTAIPTQLLEKVVGQTLVIHCASCHKDFQVLLRKQ